MNMINVCNKGALGMKFTMPDGRNLVIEGRNKSNIINSPYFITMIEENDWEYIKHTYGHVYEFVENIIFADVKIENVKAKAMELKDEKLADSKLTKKDLEKSKIEVERIK